MNKVYTDEQDFCFYGGSNLFQENKECAHMELQAVV